MAVTRERVFGRAIERVDDGYKAIGDAIGALEMAERDDDRALLAGYSGTAALRYLREARKTIEKAKALLDALSP